LCSPVLLAAHAHARAHTHTHTHAHVRAQLQPEYGNELSEVLASVDSTLLVLDGRCRVLSRLLSLYELWTTIHLAQSSKTQKPKLEVYVCMFFFARVCEYVCVSVCVCVCMCVCVYVHACLHLHVCLQENYNTYRDWTLCFVDQWVTPPSLSLVPK
jgi:hypothetical protein